LEVSKRVLLALLVLALAVFGSSRAGASPDDDVVDPLDPPEQPNVVLVYVDDMRQSDMAQLPVLQALTEERGLTFRQSFVTTSLCCPARATLLTGRYATNHQVLTNNGAGGGEQAFLVHQDNTVAVWMDDAGYETG
jgi:N-acetylglucosamine-6-sulfatase